MWKIIRLVVVAVLALLPLLTLPQPAKAALTVGPIDPRSIFQGNPNTGFPGFYGDDQGTRVSLLPITGDGAIAPTQVFEPPDLNSPYSAFLGFEGEAFYYIATADFNTRLGRANSRFAIEAAFASELAVPGQEMVFTRTRVRAQVPVPGTYTFQHPYGTETLEVTAADIASGRGINFTQDVGAVARDFTVAANANITRFLRQTVPPPPAGWIGDGVSVGPVTGSPTAFNKVRLTGPAGINLDGAGNNFVESNQFTVSARLQTAAAPTPGFTKTLNPLNGVAPNTVTFTDTSTGVPTAWSWSFGDGTSSTLQNPTKTYNTAGNFTVRLTATNGGGTASTSQTVSVFSAPVAGFTKTAPNGPPPVTINFTDISSGNITGWSWIFGDGTGSSSQNPTKTYTAGGNFNVTLTVTNPAGTASTSQALAISGNLTASFTKNPASGIAPLTVNFTDTSTGVITSRLWNFGDGATSTVQNPTKTYNTAGNFTVTLTVTDASGTAAASQTVNVFSALTASFTKSTARGLPPLTVNFTDTTTGNPASWLWIFGDGATSTIQNPTKTFTALGAFTVTLTATNPAGPSSTSQTVIVTTLDPAIPLNLLTGPIDPRSIFQGNPNSGFPGFYQDDQGTQVSLVPVTGDGLTAPTQIFEAVDPANPYSVLLGFEGEAFYYIATADFNTRAGRAHSRFAVEAAFANEIAAPGDEMVFVRTRIFALVPTPGTYTFQHPYGTETLVVTAEDIAAGRGIRFTNDVGAVARDFFASAGGNISRFLRQTVPPPPPGWIGDGVSVGPVTGSPTGFNRVRLTGPAGVNLDGLGNNFVESNQFSVAARLFTSLTPSFTKVLNPVSGIAPVTVTFTGAATGGVPTSWLWNFGDGGAASTLQNPTKTYTAAGTFTVMLTVKDATGTASTSQTVKVFSTPSASFTKSAASGITPLTVSFTDTSTGNPASWLWTFGDGSSSALQNPFKTYTVAGTFTVTLTITSPAGTASTSQTVTANAPAPPLNPPPPPGGGGGGPGGGGGGGGAPPPTTATTVTVTGLTGSETLTVSNAGVAQNSVILKDPRAPETLQVTVASGTRITDKAGAPVTAITATPLASPPKPPPDKTVVLAYKFGPAGTIFNPSLTVTMKYNPADLAPGVKETDLRMAFWDGSGWVGLGGKVDTQAKTVTAQVSHFTEFAILAELPQPGQAQATPAPTTAAPAIPKPPAPLTQPPTAPVAKTTPAPKPKPEAPQPPVQAPEIIQAPPPVPVQPEPQRPVVSAEPAPPPEPAVVAPPAVQPGPAPAQADQTNWMLIAVIAAAALVVGFLIYKYMPRKEPAP